MNPVVSEPVERPSPWGEALPLARAVGRDMIGSANPGEFSEDRIVQITQDLYVSILGDLSFTRPRPGAADLFCGELRGKCSFEDEGFAPPRWPFGNRAYLIGDIESHAGDLVYELVLVWSAEVLLRLQRDGPGLAPGHFVLLMEHVLAFAVLLGVRRTAAAHAAHERHALDPARIVLRAYGILVVNRDVKAARLEAAACAALWHYSHKLEFPTTVMFCDALLHDIAVNRRMFSLTVARAEGEQRLQWDVPVVDGGVGRRPGSGMSSEPWAAGRVVCPKEVAAMDRQLLDVLSSTWGRLLSAYEGGRIPDGCIDMGKCAQRAMCVAADTLDTIEWNGHACVFAIDVLEGVAGLAMGGLWDGEEDVHGSGFVGTLAYQGFLRVLVLLVTCVKRETAGVAGGGGEGEDEDAAGWDCDLWTFFDERPWPSSDAGRGVQRHLVRALPQVLDALRNQTLTNVFACMLFGWCVRLGGAAARRCSGPDDRNAVTACLKFVVTHAPAVVAADQQLRVVPGVRRTLRLFAPGLAEELAVMLEFLEAKCLPVCMFQLCAAAQLCATSFPDMKAEWGSCLFLSPRVLGFMVAHHDFWSEVIREYQRTHEIDGAGAGAGAGAAAGAGAGAGIADEVCTASAVDTASALAAVIARAMEDAYSRVRARRAAAYGLAVRVVPPGLSVQVVRALWALHPDVDRVPALQKLVDVACALLAQRDPVDPWAEAALQVVFHFLGPTCADPRVGAMHRQLVEPGLLTAELAHTYRVRLRLPELVHAPVPAQAPPTVCEGTGDVAWDWSVVLSNAADVAWWSFWAEALTFKASGHVRAARALVRHYGLWYAVESVEGATVRGALRTAKRREVRKARAAGRLVDVADPAILLTQAALVERTPIWAAMPSLTTADADTLWDCVRDLHVLSSHPALTRLAADSMEVMTAVHYLLFVSEWAAGKHFRTAALGPLTLLFVAVENPDVSRALARASDAWALLLPGGERFGDVAEVQTAGAGAGSGAGAAAAAADEGDVSVSSDAVEGSDACAH